MGLGKTITTLTAFCELQDQVRTGPMLVVGPLRVVQSVWRNEARKWSHTHHLRFSLIHGKPQDRLRALLMPADVYLINYEGCRWMVTQVYHYCLKRGHYPPFSMVVYDEVTRIKNQDTVVHKHMSALRPYLSRAIGLTGTPAPNGYKDLFGQYLAVDQGQRLGQSIESYRARFLTFDGWGNQGKYVVRPGMEAEIHATVADITLEMSTRDYLELPEILVNDIWLVFEGRLKTQYDQLEKEMFVMLDSEVVLEVRSVLAKSTKVRQFANGAAYVTPDDPQWEYIHDLKLDALEEVIEEANGRPVIVSYEYRHDAERIAKRWPEARFINSKLSDKEMNRLQEDFNADKVSLLCGHPKSLGHGLNLQYGSCSDIAMFGLDWSPELMDQVPARLMRQGQRSNVRIHRLLVEDTVDALMVAVLREKMLTEETMKTAVAEYRKNKGL